MTVQVVNDTRISFTVLEKETSDEYRFVLPRPSLMEEEWRECIEALQRLPEPPLPDGSAIAETLSAYADMRDQARECAVLTWRASFHRRMTGSSRSW